MRFKAFIAALLTACIGMGLLFVYMQRYEAEVRGGAPVEVLVATRDVPLGAALSEDMLGTLELPARYAQDRNIGRTDAQRILGVRVRSAIRANEMVLWTDLATTTEESRDLSALVREGMRAVTVGASVASTFGGLLRPGDRVDVLLTMDESPRGPATLPVLQNALVLAVGADTGRVRVGASETDERIHQVTLALTMEQAQLITFGGSRGQLSLTLRNPDDVAVVEALPDTQLDDLIEVERRARVQRRGVEPSPQAVLPQELR
ncbi:MAG: Flp pilus assembly protein CpaB [Myxococcota bacterium]